MSRETLEQIGLKSSRVLGLVLLCLVVGFPFYWMLLSSFRPLEQMLLAPSNLWPDLGRLDFHAYKSVLFEHGFLRTLSNSAYVSLVTVGLTLTLATLGGYAVARLRFRGREAMALSVLVIYMFPAIVLVVPLYVLFSLLGLRDSLHVLILVYLAQTLPVSLYMLDNYFRSLPVEVERAGLVDGCTRFGVIWRVVIPLSVPALASVALYAFMIAWNEFLFAFMFLDTPDKFTLSRGVFQMADSVHLSKQLVMAASVLITLPVIVLFLIAERQLVKGLTAGALKG
jgi:multiple sugar transport system permease protein